MIKENYSYEIKSRKIYNKYSGFVSEKMKLFLLKERRNYYLISFNIDKMLFLSSYIDNIKKITLKIITYSI